MGKGESSTQKTFDNYSNDKVLSPEELYEHFKLDGKNKVTMKDYRDHIKWHCENKEFNPYYKN